ncbi:putative chromosome segregation protein [Erysiphe neolycopersici]|uniref:Putative chromosome segregation protein n=1 Tax=Erysiphe neolycopersici TaxID=212602 RepID=A0A420H9W3_9PEZI|nr:putative chromosome segregation protein [Erysiphe neolycopersici]
MDVTIALGGIIRSTDSDQDTVTEAKTLSSAQVNDEKLQANQTREPESKKKFKISSVNYTSKIENGSPSLSPTRGKASKRNSDIGILKNSRHRKYEGGSTTPVNKTPISLKYSTPLLAHPIIPAQVSPSYSIILHSSPRKKLYNSKKMTPAASAVSNKIPTTPKNKSFGGKNLGFPAPNLTLTAKSRHASGIGFDKIGLGSPRVAELLDRRDSIGNNASSFILGELVAAPLGNSLKDPRLIEQEINDEREEEARHIEDIIPRQRTEVSLKESNATSNLKEMIESLTPKKNPLRGRKSLHVGAAVGLLGKRPVELDETDDTDDFEGTKRLKNHQGSPVKNVKLQAPPSKTETTSGRAMQALQNGIKNLTSESVIIKAGFNSSENKPIGLKYQSTVEKDFQQNLLKKSAIDPKSAKGSEVEQKYSKDQKIQLQDFLHMTSIRFMELTTTKRRHTIAPKSTIKNDGAEEKEISLEDCIAAGAATIPILELFQHACHELKRYISEGRKTMREIETETWEENPPLFREYISATPDLKFLMDNQLKNVKTHSRLLSKGQWYDWRMTLHGTLKEGLVKSAEGMASDEETLNNQQTLLNNILPPLILTAQNLEQEKSDLQAAAQEIANCNKEELSIARQRLTAVDENFNAKRIHLAELQQKLQGIEAEIEVKLQCKQKLLESIQESEKIKEECRGWTVSEIHAIKRRVENIEELYGWTITDVSSTKMSMTYQKEIRLVFNVLFFTENMRPKRELIDPQINIEYVGSTQKSHLLSVITKTEFFIPCIKKYVQQEAIQKQFNVRVLLDFVSKSWKKAEKIAQDIHLLTLSCPTEIIELAETSMAIRSTLLIGPLTTKVAFTFYLSANNNNNDNNDNNDNNTIEISQEVDFVIKTKASVIYGERFNELKMAEFLINRCGNDTINITKSSSWGDAVEELGEKLLARGRKSNI